MTSSVRADDLVARLRQIDWDDLREVAAEAPLILKELAADPDWLAGAFERMVGDERLRSMSERLEIFDKVVLLHDPATGARIRMHIFHDGYVDTPHNHRFNFAAMILSGEYQQTLYGNSRTDSLDIDPSVLEPRFVRLETTGSVYVIEHTLLHSVSAKAQTITLTVRGPAQKDRMLVMGRDGAPFWALGMAEEDAEQRERRILSRESLDDIRAILVSSGLIPAA